MKTTNQEDLRIYLKEVRANWNPIPIEEQETLALKAQDGCQRSLTKIVNAYLKLVLKIVNQYAHNYKNETADLIQAGNLGMIKGILNWMPNSGALPSLLSVCIKNEMLRYISENSNTVKITYERMAVKNFVAKEVMKFEEKGEIVDYEEIGLKYKKNKGKVLLPKTINYYNSISSFGFNDIAESVRAVDYEQRTDFTNFLDDEFEEDFENDLLKQELINLAIANLTSDAQREIITDVYLNGMKISDCARKRLEPYFETTRQIKLAKDSIFIFLKRLSSTNPKFSKFKKEFSESSKKKFNNYEDKEKKKNELNFKLPERTKKKVATESQRLEMSVNDETKEQFRLAKLRIKERKKLENEEAKEQFRVEKMRIRELIKENSEKLKREKRELKQLKIQKMKEENSISFEVDFSQEQIQLMEDAFSKSNRVYFRNVFADIYFDKLTKEQCGIKRGLAKQTIFNHLTAAKNHLKNTLGENCPLLK